jgi:hypothetical protein
MAEWRVETTEEFASEFGDFASEVQEESQDSCGFSSNSVQLLNGRIATD